MSSRVLLGLDTGFAAFGWAAVSLLPDGPRLADLGVIRTAKGRASLLATEDNAQRCREIWRALREMVQTWRPAALAVESQSWPRNAGTTAKCGMAWGLVFAIAEQHGLPVVHTSPKEIKRRVADRADASKEDVQRALEGRPGFHHLAQALEAAGLPSSMHEHAVDAAAAAFASIDTEIVRALGAGVAA